MLDSRPNLVFVIVLTILAVFGFLFYVWLSSTAPASSPETLKFSLFPPPEEKPGPSSEVLGQTFIQNQSSVRFSIFKETPLTIVPEEISLNVFETFLAPFQDTFIPSPPPATPSIPPAAPITVSDKEIFEFGYPESYRQILRDLNQVMIDDGFLAPGEIFPLATMEEAVLFQDKFADYLLYLAQFVEEGSWFNKEEIENYRKAYREILPKLWEEELKAKKAEESTSSLLKLLYAYRRSEIRKEIAAKFTLFENFKTLVFAVAEANHSTSPCFREGTPNLLRGSQRAAPCCNCGIHFHRGRRGRIIPHFHEDCGHAGEGCDIQLGCLNRACPNLPAIWDPSTSICGCHI